MWLGIHLFLITMVSQGISAQENIYHIIFKQDFEATTQGAYLRGEWMNDWNNPPWENGLDRTQIVQVDGSRVMKFNYPAGTISPDNGGGQWLSNFGPGHEEVYFSYNVMFRPGFEWVLGGKLPGLGGGSNPGGGVEMFWDSGFSVRMMWNKDEGSDGTLFFYVYHQDKPTQYGDTYQFPYNPLSVSDSAWHNLTIRLVLNSIDASKLTTDPENAGNKDGILEFFLNGKLVFSKSGIRFRNLSSITIDTQHIASYFGGNTLEWASARDEWALFDDFTVFTYSDQVSVPRGRTPSPAGRILQLPNMKDTPVDTSGNTGTADEEPPSVPRGLSVAESTTSSVTVRWDPCSDNVAVTGFRLFLDGEEAGTTKNRYFTVRGLEPGASYQVTVAAYDAAANESRPSDPLVITTVSSNPDPDPDPDPADNQPPSTPGGLRVLDAASNSLVIAWNASTDNVQLEGYNIYLNGVKKGSTQTLMYPLVELQPSTDYAVAVTAYDASGNESAADNTLTARTLEADTIPPSTPDGLTPTIITQSSIALMWDESEDNVRVSGYGIYVNGVRKATSTTNAHNLTELMPGIDYTITVSAFDASSNESTPSSGVRAYTKHPDEISESDLPELSIVDLRNSSNTASVTSSISSYGFVQMEDYGLRLQHTVNGQQVEEFFYPEPDASHLSCTGRAEENLQLMYDFSCGSGDQVRDMSEGGDPLNLQISDPLAARWLSGQGLQILGSTLISSGNGSQELSEAIRSTRAFTLEAWIKPAEIFQSQPVPIVRIADETGRHSFTLMHAGNKAYYEYGMRISEGSQQEAEVTELVTQEKFISLQMQHVVFSVDQNGISTFFVDGMKVYQGTFDGDLSDLDGELRVVLSNGLDGGSTYYGTYYMVAIYNRALKADEIYRNHQAGYGEIEFTTDLLLEPNTSYQVAPFVQTGQGTFYGQSKTLLIRNVLSSATNDSLYMAVYPNPSNGDFFIHVENHQGFAGQAVLMVSDLSGQNLYSRELFLPSELEVMEEEIQLSGILPDGIYTLILVAGEQSAAARLVISH